MTNRPPVFEVKPSVHYDDITKKWYAATTLYTNGEKQQSELWSQIPFANVRRARNFARFLAEQQEARCKQLVIENLISSGLLPPKKEDTPNG